VNTRAHTDAMVKKRHIDAVAMRSAGIAVVSRPRSRFDVARRLITGIVIRMN